VLQEPLPRPSAFPRSDPLAEPPALVLADPLPLAPPFAEPPAELSLEEAFPTKIFLTVLNLKIFINYHMSVLLPIFLTHI
jgi:hypothetical protein